MTPEDKTRTTGRANIKKPAPTPHDRAKREMEWSDGTRDIPARERESYRDGGYVNECWDRKNY